MKPDYGFRLAQEGVTSDIDLFLYGHMMFSIDVLGRGRYSTMAEKEHGGAWYAVSLDFGHEHLDRILSTAPPHVVRQVRSELTRDGTSPRNIDLVEPIQVDVRARLGQPQKGRSEVFVPLVCKEILPGPHTPRRGSTEILPQLRTRFGSHVRPEITSIRFGQEPGRCYLEIHTMKRMDSLVDEAMTRTDLGFVTVGDTVRCTSIRLYRSPQT